MGKKLDEMLKEGSYEKIRDAKKDISEMFLNELHMKGANEIDIEDAGKTIDMIKDLAEAEKCCMEACYYKKIIKAMEEVEEVEEIGNRLGYNNRRYANGRYAPKGAGTRMGFRPYMDEEPYVDAYIHDPNFMEQMRMGYRSQTGTRMNDYGNTRNGYSDGEDDPRYGREYNEYRKARRHYTETKSPGDKQEMDIHANHHLMETMDTFRDIWKDADPAMRKEMKTHLTNLIGEMPA